MKVEIVTDHDVFDECIEQMAQQSLVLDLGGCHRFHNRLSAWERRFEGVRCYCLDILPSQDLDVIGDLLALSLLQGGDAIYCLAVAKSLGRDKGFASRLLYILGKEVCYCVGLCTVGR